MSRPRLGAPTNGLVFDVKLLSKRHRMRPADVVATATVGPRTRKVRSLLSALGIGIGVAALVATLGIPASQKAQTVKELQARGANLVAVLPGRDIDGNTLELPETAPVMLEKANYVTSVVTLRGLDDVNVYQSNKVPVTQMVGAGAVVAEGDFLDTFKVSLAQGTWFDAASQTLPTAVLGYGAAQSLGARTGFRIWADQRWWGVIGVLEHNPQAAELDDAVFLARDPVISTHGKLAIRTVYVAAQTGKTREVKAVAAAMANPANPTHAKVETNDEIIFAQDTILTTFQNLALGLGAVALLVGAIGIANTMVVAVMERRSEIGLRRAMGARAGQIVLQFVLEAALIGLIGGLLGIALGSYMVFIYVTWIDIAFAVPLWVVAASPAVSMLIGGLAGLYPSLKAARVSPTVALRSI